MVGNGVAGKGGRVVGKVGFGKEGIWVLGNGGNVDFGRVGWVGSDGNGGSVVVGSGGNVAWGSVGTEGNGGNVGRDGAAGVCNSWRAAKLILMLDKDNVTIKAKMKTCLQLAIVWLDQRDLASLFSIYMGNFYFCYELKAWNSNCHL